MDTPPKRKKLEARKMPENGDESRQSTSKIEGTRQTDRPQVPSKTVVQHGSPCPCAVEPGQLVGLQDRLLGFDLDFKDSCCTLC